MKSYNGILFKYERSDAICSLFERRSGMLPRIRLRISLIIIHDGSCNLMLQENANPAQAPTAPTTTPPAAILRLDGPPCLALRASLIVVFVLSFSASTWRNKA